MHTYTQRAVWTASLAICIATAGCTANGVPETEPTTSSVQSGSPAPSSSVSPSVSGTPLAPSAHSAPSDPPASSINGLPPELAGLWCSALSGDCFSFAGLKVQYPDMFLDDGEELSQDSPTSYLFCFENDGGSSGCSIAASGIYEYYPTGVEWACQEAAEAAGFASCDPDYTDLHDVSRARLLHVPNHQMGTLYEDVPPYYRQEG